MVYKGFIQYVYRLDAGKYCQLRRLLVKCLPDVDENEISNAI